VSFRDLIGLTDHCSWQEDFATPTFTEGVCQDLTSTVVSREEEVSNSSLNFKQFSFTHIIQVLGQQRW